ncbi:uncharacterized protein LOC110279550 [Arachis duranensis]|uniref:Uncharacterized protein LOC110279550 n=1 Tax=Arachis duranensis TaxID=130453 RepID=A0A9C6TEH0_ARADU|nr:uncharacterized protein LOC110279550 [Arachis duranensis]
MLCCVKRVGMFLLMWRKEELYPSGCSHCGSSCYTAPKKSWIPAVKAGGNFIDPEWLDASPRQRSSISSDGTDREAELIHGLWLVLTPLRHCHCSFLLWFSFGDTIASHGLG